MRVGLVLGSGGILGAAYLIGALEGLRRLTGWEPAMATRIVGTSAGAYVAALSCALPTWLMDAHCTGDLPDNVTVPQERWDQATRLDRYNDGSFWRRFPPAWQNGRPLFSSLATVWSAIARSGPPSWELLATGLIGHGFFSNRSVAAVVNEACGSRWPHPDLWVTACELDSGHRTIFRADQDQPVSVAEAVAASTAIPGLFAPVVISGSRYVDGGAWSASNADLLVEADVDVILAVLPLAGRDLGGSTTGLLDRFDRWTRRRTMARLDREVAPLVAAGKPVVVLTPSAQDWPSSLWLDHMNIARRPAMIQAAREATMQRLLADDRLAWFLDGLRREAAPVRQKVA